MADELIPDSLEDEASGAPESRWEGKRRWRRILLADGKKTRIWVPKLHNHRQLLDYCALVIKLVERGMINPEQAQAIEALLARAQEILKDQHLTAELVRKARQIVEEE